VLYAALTAWETEHVRHHLLEIQKLKVVIVAAQSEPDEPKLAA